MVTKTAEKGQALILIAFAAVVLFAFAALAIDGGRVYSDKRHAQNAADTAALAAALSWVRVNDWYTAVDAGQARATSNGYNNDGQANVVEIYLCADARATCTALKTGADPNQYIEVKITSHVKTTFARVIGRSEIINHVNAVVHVIPGYRTNSFKGQSLVALNKNACSAFTYGGNGKITVTGSGIFINSKCTDLSNGALNSNASGTLLSVPCYGLVGTKTIGHSETLVTTGGCGNLVNQGDALFMSDPMSTIPHPDVDCNSLALGTATTSGGKTTITPGRYNSSNTGNTFPATSWSTNVVMKPGVYCIDIGSHTFSLSGGQVLSGSNVFIYMKSGGVSWTSGEIHLSAMSGIDPLYDGLLLYLAYPGNCQDVSITGNGGSSFVGTILAPCSNVKIAGGSGTGTVGVLENQIIADTIGLTGGADLIINYNATEQWKPPIPPSIEINQ